MPMLCTGTTDAVKRITAAAAATGEAGMEARISFDDFIRLLEQAGPTDPLDGPDPKVTRGIAEGRQPSAARASGRFRLVGLIEVLVYLPLCYLALGILTILTKAYECVSIVSVVDCTVEVHAVRS